MTAHALAPRQRYWITRPELVPILLLAPTVIWLAALFIAPLGLMFGRSIVQDGQLTLLNYHEIITTPLYRNVLITTLRFSLITTGLCLLIGYPFAFALLQLRGLWRNVLLICVIVPYWLDFIVRSYAWMILLGRTGLVNQWLLKLGLVSDPRTMLGTDFAVLIGMVQIMLPLMVLTLYAGMLRIEEDLLRAASIHGAGPFATFREVFLPLSRPAAIAGSLLVFVNALGFFVTPALLGGPRQTMISQSIDVLASRLLDWPLASAAAMLLLISSGLVLVAFNSWFGLERAPGGRT
jgi:ABC-type spermidine/putrescine transport system permease subunit I